MELQALLILCSVGVAGVAAVLLLMGLFSASGTSYEEAIAQQRKATTELLALAENKNKAKKTNKKEKKEKKLAKKEKTRENAASTAGTDPDSEALAESGMEDDPIPSEKPHVEFRSLVDEARDVPPVNKIRKRGKDPKVKPILVNKEDPSCVSDPASLPKTAIVANHFEEIHPKDEFELLHSAHSNEKVTEKKEEVVEKKEVKPAKVTKGSKAAQKSTVPVAADAPKEEPIRESHNSGNGPKESRKQKKADKKPIEDVRVEEKEEIVPPLNVPQPSEMTTDKLLKQALAPTTAPPAPSPPASKNKKKKAEPNVLTLMAGDSGGVNVGELVNVIRQAALSRDEIQILTDALLNKHHDLLPEHSEWSEGPNDPMQKLKKQLAEKEKALADELEASKALQAKLKELRSSLNAERGRVSASARASEQAASAHRAELHTLQARLQRLADDNHALAQDKHLLQNKEAEAQAQRVQMEMHIQRLTEAENGLVQQLTALQTELNARMVEVGQARLEATAARDNAIMAQQHAAELAQQLQDANLAFSELEQQRQRAVHGEQLAQHELCQAQERLNATTELQNEVQRLTTRAQTAESNLEKTTEELEKQKQQLSSLREQLAERESELAELKQMKAVPAQNGLPAASEQHKAAELAKVESVVEALRGELAGAKDAAQTQRQEIERLRNDLTTYQTKNNELRTKNWKVMEALQSAEKALQTKSPSALPAQDALREAIQKAQEAQYNEIANVLRAACPSAAPGTAAGSDWLHAFADNLKKQLEKVEKVEKVVVKTVEKVVAEPNTRLVELQAQNETLQGLVDKYKRIIDDTEGVLSRLQANVSSEEQRWARQLQDKQRELDDLRARTVLQMQKKIDHLQEELDRSQSAQNSKSSFADAERLTQENLMASLSEKYSVDVSNGPLQVGLEEK